MAFNFASNASLKLRSYKAHMFVKHAESSATGIFILNVQKEKSSINLCSGLKGKNKIR